LVYINNTVGEETEKLQTLFGEVKIAEKEHEDILASIEEAKSY
jgi:ABC-type enterochelin transport system substrate-binding protein